MSDVALSASTSTTPDLTVITGLTLEGRINTDEATIAAHIAHAIRQQHPQLRPQAACYDRVALVGGGPSLADTEGELVALIRDGAKLVTVNGAYHWALAHNLTPRTQIVMDARASNARFVDPPVPQCNYLLASQCHPDVWARVRDRERVMVFHAVNREESHAALLDAYYGKHWQTVNGGTTAAHRALFALVLLGYRRFDLFGVDCCIRPDGTHHAYAQAENDADTPFAVTVAPSAAPEQTSVWHASAWMLKALEDWLKVFRVQAAGPRQFVLHVHGDGLLAHCLKTSADLVDVNTEA